jgi:hypothetical protein
MTDFTSIPREITPPAGLDRKIARELRRQGLLQRRRLLPYLAAAAAVMAVIAVWQVRPAKTSPNYILLLYESPQFHGGNRAEYGQWARQMRPLIAGGEELGTTELMMAGSNTPLPNSTPKLAGYFLIDAADDASATRVARACPHLRHGGAVVLRKIVQ